MSWTAFITVEENENASGICKTVFIMLQLRRTVHNSYKATKKKKSIDPSD